MRISDWSLDVCSSDLRWPERWAFQRHVFDVGALQTKAGVSSFGGLVLFGHGVSCNGERVRASGLQHWDEAACADRKSVVSGKRVSVRVDLGGSRIINKNTTTCMS